MAAPRVDCTLAAIMAADAVGYSRLVQRDEQSTLDQLKIHRKELVEPLATEHGGRVVKLDERSPCRDRGEILEELEPTASTSPSRLHSIGPANPCPGWPGIWRLSRRERPRKPPPSLEKTAKTATWLVCLP